MDALNSSPSNDTIVRRIAARYEKTIISFMAMVKFVATMISRTA
jgi:hypothetical protein